MMRHTKPLVTILAVALIATLGGVAQAEMITAEDDAIADKMHPNTVYDSTSTTVRDHGSWAYKSWIKFDLSGQNADADESATFRVVYTSTKYAPTLRASGLDAGFTSPGGGVLGTDWSETELTWNSAPANNTTSGSLLRSEATLIGSKSYTSAPTIGTEVEFEISKLGDYLQSDNTVTIIMTSVGSVDATNDRFNFAARDHATYDGPELDFAQIPEPGSICLLLSGVAAIAATCWFRRRRRSVK